jgi:enterochelin esterase family protein
MTPLRKRNPQIRADQAVFYWHGPQAPILIGDFNRWNAASGTQFQPVAAGLWAATVMLPMDAYMEYAFLLGGKRMLDPLNPRSRFNGFEAYNNYFYMPAARPTPLARRRKQVPHGRNSRQILKNPFALVGGQREVIFYQPPVEHPSPLLVVYDGPDYRTRANLVNLIENLAAEGRIQPPALALLQNGGKARGIEYSCNEATVEFVIGDVLPAAKNRLNLLDFKENPGIHAIMGASLGGLMALYSALRHPEIFGKVISQSGAFSYSKELVIFDLVRCCKPRDLRLWMDVGLYEGLLETNRTMVELLREKGYQLDYHEYPSGHTYSAWREDVWRGLEALFKAD